MPTQNPRLTITMQPSLAAQLRRLSELTGNSQSALIAELLETSAPTFDRLILVLEAAQKVTETARNARFSATSAMATELAEAQTRIETQMGLNLAEFDQLNKPILEEAERITRRARKTGLARDARSGALQPSSTPLSNRGVRSTPKTHKNTIKSRG